MNPSFPTLYDPYGRALAPSARWGMYQASRWGGRERRNVFAVADDARETGDRYARTQSAALARHLIANLGRVRGPLFDLTRYSIGNGLVPQSQAQDDRAAAEHEAYFADWTERCDVSGKFTYYELQKIASRAMDGDGDVGANTVIPGRNKDHLLQLVEGHRIESDGVDEEAGWNDGVRTDAYGRALEFRVREGEDEYRTIEAGFFRLLMDPDRCSQDRGISALAHAIDNAFDSDDILTFSKIGVKMREAIGFAVYTETGAHDSGLGYIKEGDEATSNSLAMDTLQAGMIPRLKINERIQDIGSGRPNPVFTGYLDYLIRDFAVGLGLPFEFVWDPVRAGGPGQRFVMAKAQRRFEERQALMAKVVRYDWTLVIGRAIARKELRPDPFWRRITIQAPAKSTIDVGREAQQNREDMKFGARTLAEDAGERGCDWKAVRAQVEKEARDLLVRAQGLAKEFGLTLEKAVELLRQNSPNPVPTPAPQAEQE